MKKSRLPHFLRNNRLSNCIKNILQGCALWTLLIQIQSPTAVHSIYFANLFSDWVHHKMLARYHSIISSSYFYYVLFYCVIKQCIITGNCGNCSTRRIDVIISKPGKHLFFKVFPSRRVFRKQILLFPRVFLQIK